MENFTSFVVFGAEVVGFFVYVLALRSCVPTSYVVVLLSLRFGVLLKLCCCKSLPLTKYVLRHGRKKCVTYNVLRHGHIMVVMIALLVLINMQ